MTGYTVEPPEFNGEGSLLGKGDACQQWRPLLVFVTMKLGVAARVGRALSALLTHPHDQGYDEKDQKYKEQNLGYLDGAGGNAAKTQNRRDDGYDEEDCSPFQHGDPLPD